MFNGMTYNSQPYNAVQVLVRIIPSVVMPILIENLTIAIASEPQTITLSSNDETIILR